VRTIWLGFFLIIVLAAAPMHPASAQSPVKIRAGWVSTPASLVPLLFLKPGITKHHGKSYMFEPVYFASRPLCKSLQSARVNSTSLPSATPAFRSRSRTPDFQTCASSPTKSRMACPVIIQRRISCVRILESTESRI
jgi:hypothetical protein